MDEVPDWLKPQPAPTTEVPDWLQPPDPVKGRQRQAAKEKAAQLAGVVHQQALSPQSLLRPSDDQYKSPLVQTVPGEQGGLEHHLAGGDEGAKEHARRQGYQYEQELKNQFPEIADQHKDMRKALEGSVYNDTRQFMVKQLQDQAEHAGAGQLGQSWDVVRNLIPGHSTGAGIGRNAALKDSYERMAKGEATGGDYGLIGYTLAEEKLNAQKGLPQKLLDFGIGAPKMMAEWLGTIPAGGPIAGAGAQVALGNIGLRSLARTGLTAGAGQLAAGESPVSKESLNSLISNAVFEGVGTPFDASTKKTLAGALNSILATEAGPDIERIIGTGQGGPFARYMQAKTPEEKQQAAGDLAANLIGMGVLEGGGAAIHHLKSIGIKPKPEIIAKEMKQHIIDQEAQQAAQKPPEAAPSTPDPRANPTLEEAFRGMENPPERQPPPRDPRANDLLEDAMGMKSNAKVPSARPEDHQGPPTEVPGNAVPGTQGDTGGDAQRGAQGEVTGAQAGAGAAPAVPERGAGVLKPDILSLVREAGKTLPDTFNGKYHHPSFAGETHKVLVADLYDKLKPKLGGMSLDEFKQELLRHNREGALSLSRVDMVNEVGEARGSKQLERSKTQMLPGREDYITHSIDVNGIKVPEKPLPESWQHSGTKFKGDTFEANGETHAVVSRPLEKGDGIRLSVPGEGGKEKAFVNLLKNPDGSYAISEMKREGGKDENRNLVRGLVDYATEQGMKVVPSTEGHTPEGKEFWQKNAEKAGQSQQVKPADQIRGLLNEINSGSVTTGRVDKMLSDMMASKMNKADWQETLDDLKIAGQARSRQDAAAKIRQVVLSQLEMHVKGQALGVSGVLTAEQAAQARVPKPTSLLSVVKKNGGLSRQDATDHGWDVKALEENVPSIFRNSKGGKGSQKISEALEGLISEGHVPKGGEVTADRMLELVQDHARSMADNLDREFAREEARYYAERERAKQLGHSEESIEKSARLGQTHGEAEGRERTPEEINGELAGEQGSEAGDFEFGANRPMTQQVIPGTGVMPAFEKGRQGGLFEQPQGKIERDFQKQRETEEASLKKRVSGPMQEEGGMFGPPAGGMGAMGGGTEGGEPPPGTPQAGTFEPPERGTPPPGKPLLQRTADWLKSFGGQAFPAVHRLARATGEALTRLTNSKSAADKFLDYAENILSVPKEALDRPEKPGEEGTARSFRLSELTLPERKRIGAAFLEKRMRYFRDELLATGEKDKADKVATFIGSDVLPDEATFKRINDALDPFYQAWIQEWTPEVEKNFRGIMDMAPDEAIDSKSQIPGLPLNARAISPSKGEPIPPGAVATKARGNLSNIRVNKPGFTKEASLDAPAYDVDIRNMMEHTLQAGGKAARKAEFVRQAIQDGVIQSVAKGEEPNPGWKALELKPSYGLSDLPPGNRYYAHPDAYSEVRTGLGLNEPASGILSAVSKGMGIINSTALLSPVEIMSHVANHLTALFRPGMGFPMWNLGQSAGNFAKVLMGDPTMLRKVADLAAMGASFSHGDRPGVLGQIFGTEGAKPGSWHETAQKATRYDPTQWANKFTGKFIDTMQSAIRVQLADAYDRLAQQGHFPQTEQGKRDFVNQAVGNYNSLASSKIVQFLKDTGLQPFATAATTFTTQGVRATYGGGLNAMPESWDAAARQRGIAYAKMLPLMAIGPTLNYLLWGNAFPKNTPAFSVKTGEDEDGTIRHMDPLRLAGVRRGARITGLNAVAERALGTDRDNQTSLADRAANDAWRGVEHFFAGPAVAALYTAKTGQNTFGHQMAPVVSKATTSTGAARAEAMGKPAPGSSQYLENIKAAALNVNPTVAAFSQADKPKKPRSLGENVGRMFGPFAPQERTPPKKK